MSGSRYECVNVCVGWERAIESINSRFESGKHVMRARSEGSSKVHVRRMRSGPIPTTAAAWDSARLTFDEAEVVRREEGPVLGGQAGGRPAVAVPPSRPCGLALAARIVIAKGRQGRLGMRGNNELLNSSIDLVTRIHSSFQLKDLRMKITLENACSEKQ